MMDEKKRIENEEEGAHCESCLYNNNADWIERNCPIKFVGMCAEEKR